MVYIATENNNYVIYTFIQDFENTMSYIILSYSSYSVFYMHMCIMICVYMYIYMIANSVVDWGGGAQGASAPPLHQ